MTHRNTKKNNRKTKNKIKTKKGGNKKILSKIFDKKHINKKNLNILLSLYFLNEIRKNVQFIKKYKHDKKEINKRDNSNCQADAIIDILKKKNDVNNIKEICTEEELINIMIDVKNMIDDADIFDDTQKKELNTELEKIKK